MLVGGGDPVLSEAWYAQPSAGRKRPPNTITGLEALADAVVAAGVTQVTGRVVGDGSRYDDEFFPPGWAEDLRRTFDFPPVDALSVNDTTSRACEVVGTDPALHAAGVFAQLLRDRGVAIGGDAGTGVLAHSAVGVLASQASLAGDDRP